MCDTYMWLCQDHFDILISFGDWIGSQIISNNFKPHQNIEMRCKKVQFAISSLNRIFYACFSTLVSLNEARIFSNSKRIVASSVVASSVVAARYKPYLVIENSRVRWLRSRVFRNQLFIRMRVESGWRS